MKHEYEYQDRLLARIKRECHFGILEAGAALIASLATSAGVGAATAATIGTVGMGVVTGAGLGAGEAAIMGGDPGMGALGGAISGGVLSGAGPVLGSALGNATAGDVLAGAAGGTLSAAATGSDLGMGALSGAGSGLIKAGMEGDLFGGDTVAPNAAGPLQSTGGGPGAGAGGAPAIAAPPGVEAVTVTAPSMAAGVTPTLSGLSVGGAGQPKTPSAQTQTQAAQPKGQIGNVSGVVGAGTGNVLNPGGISSGVENVTVTAPSQPGVGITPTAAGIAPSAAPGAVAGQSAASTDDPNKKDQSYWDKLTGKTEDFLSNPAVLLGGGLLLAEQSGLIGGGAGAGAGNIAGGTAANANQLEKAAQGNVAQSDKLTGLGDTNTKQAQQLESYLTNGGLPPGMQAQIDAAREAAKAGTKQMYANLGMGQGNTSLYADLANIEMQAAATAGTMQENLYNTGLTQQGVANNLYQQALANTNAGSAIYQGLLQTNMAQDENLSKGVNNFVTALANMSKTVTPYTTG
jgi:hypothetical protein